MNNKMSTNLQELQICAYQEIREQYNIAINVTKFTWQLYSARNVTIVTGAGYIFINHNQIWWVSIILLFLGLISSVGTGLQMNKNQAVIIKALCAGILLEYKNNNLGYLYRMSIKDNARNEFFEKYGTGNKEIEASDFCKIGEKPNTEIYCYVLAIFYLFAIMGIFLTLDY